MLIKKYSLAIVQSHPTQFDGPLFKIIAAHPDIELTVCYTSSQAHNPSYDPEINRRSGWDHDITSGYNYYLFPVSILKRFLLARDIVKHAKHDLVIVAGYNSLLSLVMAILGKFYRTPVGLRGDSVFTYRQNNWKWKLKDVVLPRLFRLFATGHPTGSLTHAVMRYYGLSDAALFYFPYAVDNDYLKAQFWKIAPRRNVQRQAMGIGLDDFVVLGVLKFVPREDPLTLVHAYCALVKQYPQTHLILVGDGSLMADISRLVREQGLAQVHLPGYLPYSELPGYFALADVFVHPAKVEPWGVSVNEAMVCGLPVIVADSVGAGADLVEVGKTGFVYKAGHPDLLADQIEKLINNQVLTRSMGLNAVQRIAEWSYAKTLEQTIQALDYVSKRKVNHE